MNKMIELLEEIAKEHSNYQFDLKQLCFTYRGERGYLQVRSLVKLSDALELAGITYVVYDDEIKIEV